MTSWLNHKALRIIKGVGKYPTDSNSPEADPVPVDLMAGAITLDVAGWSPNIPALKNGGVWADSPISDGRQLLAASDGNVLEKITVNITDSSYLGVMKALDSLNKMVDDCRDFWQTQVQIDPVYLMWSAGCNTPPLPQYALLYNIELAPEYLDSPSQPTMRVVMTLEREPYWRGIPPGQNPKMWTFYVNPTQPTTTNLELRTRTDDLIYDNTVVNKHEWNPADYLTPLSKNYIDIPATKLPGDAPTLVELMVKTPKNTLGGNPLTARNIYVWRSTRPTTIKDRSGNLFGQSDVINACDCFTSVATVTNDATNGVLSNGSAVTKSILTYTVLASASVADLFSTYTAVRGIPVINLERGQISLFLRCKQTTGALGDVQVRFRLTNEVSAASSALVNYFTGDYVNIPILNANYPFGMIYLGTFTLPVGGKAVMSGDGRGLNVPTKSTQIDLALSFDIRNNAAANRNIRFLDFALMHSDEALMVLNQPTFDGLSLYAQTESYLFDNTGYFGHGNTDPIGLTGLTTNAGFLPDLYPEVVGSNLTLVPNANNRLYFMSTFGNASVAPTDVESGVEAALNYEIRINVVPRWTGIRDA